MKNSNLFKTNLVVSIVLIIGFALTAVFSYRANYQASLNNIEQVSSLTAEGIYFKFTTMFAKPVNISLAMSHDSLLVDHLRNEEEHFEDDEYIETTKTYLETYRKKYGFDSVFLVSTASRRYYNFNGLDRVIEENSAEDDWYYQLLDSDLTYTLNIDTDKVQGADKEITVFVDCKIEDQDGTVLGIVGVGIRINYLMDMIKAYEDKYNISACLIGGDGRIEISTTYTGYEEKDWFLVHGQNGIKDQVLGWKEEGENLELWSASEFEHDEKSYIVARYIPELSWHLVIEQNDGKLISKLHRQVYQTFFVLSAVILVVLVVITTVIRNFNKQITELMEERQAMFKKATEQLYDNIYEINITRNCCVGKRTEEYFESLGAKGLPYDQGLQVIAKKQIKEGYREGYTKTFSPDNVIREYEAGNNHLRYDFMITQDGENYFWMRIDAHIFFSGEDDSIHMFIYRKNIELEKQREQQAMTDEMTGLLTKTATERRISALLEKDKEGGYGFFIFDIDNFKQANDKYGHAFGDVCIRKFTENLKSYFRADDILGRIGGDEFAAFIPAADMAWVEEKVKMLSEVSNIVCIEGDVSWNMSASIGVAVAPKDGSDFETLYRKADIALYQTKQRKKNGYTIFHEA